MDFQYVNSLIQLDDEGTNGEIRYAISNTWLNSLTTSITNNPIDNTDISEPFEFQDRSKVWILMSTVEKNVDAVFVSEKVWKTLEDHFKNKLSTPIHVKRIGAGVNHRWVPAIPICITDEMKIVYGLVFSDETANTVLERFEGSMGYDKDVCSLYYSNDGSTIKLDGNRSIFSIIPKQFCRIIVKSLRKNTGSNPLRGYAKHVSYHDTEANSQQNNDIFGSIESFPAETESESETDEPEPGAITMAQVGESQVLPLQLVEILSSKKGAGVVGLNNMGNTCFMNSGLQCLLSSPPLIEFFLSTSWRSMINKKNKDGTGGHVARGFGELIENAWSGKFRSIAPRDFKQAIQRFNPRFRGFAQEDSHELILSTLDGLLEDMNQNKKKTYVEVPELCKTRDEHARLYWEAHQSQIRHPIMADIQGQYYGSLKCTNCNGESHTFDPFMVLSLPIPSPKKVFRVVFVPRDGEPVEFGFVGSSDIVGSSLKRVIAEKLGINTSMFGLARMSQKRSYTYNYTSSYSSYSNRSPNRGKSSVEFKVIDSNERVEAARSYYSRPADSKLLAFETANSSTASPQHKVLAVHFGKRSRSSYGRTSYDKLSVAPVFISYTGQRDEINPATISDIIDPIIEIHGVDILGIKHVTGYNTDYFVAEIGSDSVSTLTTALTRDLNGVRKDNSVLESLGTKGISLRNCFEELSTPECLDTDETWKCPHCKQRVSPVKMTKLWSAPKMLTIQLKRFGANSSRYHRVDTDIDFPEVIDIAPFVEHPQQSTVYELYAVSLHHGSLGGGHYTAAVKHAVNRSWFYCDDSHVRSCDLNSVSGSAAYVLMYMRRE
ncbi:hypothetical protein PCE1_001268 [Barthelona sp. PCE]